jgi:acyl-CoA thioesterase I
MNPMLLRPTLLLVCLFAASVFCGEPSLLVKNLSSGKKQHLIVYGTSLTAGGAWVGQVKTALEKKFPGLLTVTNSAKGGMWSKWGVENLDEKVLKLKPDTVIIEFAINDAFAKYATPVDAAKKNLETMIERIQKENPAAEVILMTMNPPTKEHAERRPGIEKYYQMYRDVAAARKLRLVDLEPHWQKILSTDKAKFEAIVPDGIHPNAKGSEAVTTPDLLKALNGE